MNRDPHLIDWLRKIQLTWELAPSELSRLSHISEEVLAPYLKLSMAEIDALPSVPSGLENAMGLVGIFRRIQDVYPTPELQNDWLKKPNQIFEGNRPIDVMAMSPDHLLYVGYAVESGLRLV